MNIKIEEVKEINKKVKDILVINVYKKGHNNLKKNLTKLLKSADLNFVTNIEKKINNKEIDLSLYIKIKSDTYHIFIKNLLLDDEDYDIINKRDNIDLDIKKYNVVEYEKDTYIDNNMKIGKIIDIFRLKGSNCYKDLENNDISEINVAMISDFADKINGKLNSAFIEGLILSSYKFDKYKTDNKKTENNKTDNKKTDNKKKDNNIKCILVFPNISEKRFSIIKKDSIRLLNKIETVFFAQNLVNEPGLALSSKKFIELTKNFISKNKLPLNVEVFERNKLKQLDMNLLVSVGEGSKPDYQSRLMMIHYNPKNKGAKCNNPDYVLIGKGVTFDTGGYTLKIGDDTFEMKYDMAGAAVVTGFILGHSKMNGESSVVCMVPLAENAINGENATKPGDIIKSRSGKTVEIIDTDAEGRLMMADCLSYANDNFGKSIIIDFATLTGSQYEFSCKMFANAISRNIDLLRKISYVSNYIQEKIIYIPYLEEFKRYIESDSADVRNIARRACSSDMISASVFLGQFIDKDKNWVHIDFAGPGWGNLKEYYPNEGNAFGIRFLYQFIH